MTGAEARPPHEPADAFVHRLVVRFHEIDRAGIAYFTRAYEYCHAAFEEMLVAALGVDLERFFSESAWMMPLVHSEADYAAPMRISDRLVVELRVERLGASSITFAYRITGEDGVARAQLRLVHACISRADFRKRPLPESLVEGLKRLGLVGDDD